MTPEVKAKDLLKRFGKKIAIAFVDEMMNFNHAYFLMSGNYQDYWQKVRNEIIKRKTS